MLSLLKERSVWGALAVAIMLTIPTWGADPRSGTRGNNQAQPQAQSVSRQDAFFGQTQARQEAFFSQPVFPQQPFNQNATILPPVFYSPMQLNYQGAPAGIIPGTGASFNPVLINRGSSFQPGFTAPPAIANINVNSTFPALAMPATALPAGRHFQNFSNHQTSTQIMPRMGLLGRW